MRRNKKVVLIGALPSSLYNFRGDLLIALKQRDLTVTAMASGANQEEVKSIKKLVDSYVDFPVQRNGLNPFKDLESFLFLKKVLRELKPNVVLAYTIKPVIWGGIASRFIPSTSFYALITGLGYAFQPGGLFKSILNNLVKRLYKFSLAKAKGVIFQNRDNMEVFIQNGIVPKCKCFLVNGSGVELQHYGYTPLGEEPHFLLIARLLGDKGIREYVEAASAVKLSYPKAKFELLGPQDPSPDGIAMEEVYKWVEEGKVIYTPSQEDVRPYISHCSIYVLPSYHEGMPRTVLEAMAMGRPILTTDVPGCRETVANGENGWLVEKKNAKQLAEKMIWFIENQDKWQIMGEKSRIMATEKFDVHKVNADIMKIMELNDETNF